MSKKNYNNLWSHGLYLGGPNYMYLDLLPDGRLKVFLGQKENGKTTFRREYNVDAYAVKTLHEALDKLYSATPAQQPPTQTQQLNAPVKQPTIVATLADVKAKVLEKEPQATKAYEKWTDKDDKMLRNMHDLGSAVEQMAISLHRGEGAITSRLKKLGLTS